jgi:enoyl-CoA hydratase/carnithine racemase
MPELVHIERPRDGLAEIILNRPDKRNALTPQMIDHLMECVREVNGDASARAVVLRGEGRCFCAGFDLSLCRENSDALRELLIGLSHAVRALRRMRQPVIAAAHTAAIAGGCALLGGADLVITDRHARLGYPVVTLGISPAVSAPSLLNLTGDRHARARMLDPVLVSGEEARRIGLATIMVDLAEDVIPRSQIEALKLADKPAGAIAATKAWLNRVDGSLDDDRFTAALDASLSLVGTPEERALLARLWTT